MSRKFSKRLDLLTENLDDATTDIISIAQELMHNISQMKQDIEKAEVQMTHILEELNSSLGREIRKIQPKMAISLRNGMCGCGYQSKDIECRPDIENGIWVVRGRLGNGLKRNYPEVLRLNHDVTPLARAITSYFKKHYRSL
jgi:hypothetical protein